MTKKQLHTLVKESYTGNELDEKKVHIITSKLKRKDLKSYIRALKLTENKKLVTVALPSAKIYNATKQIFFDLFPGKTITMSEDRLLMLGGRVQADDMVYDFSLRRKLEDILLEIDRTYGEE